MMQGYYYQPHQSIPQALAAFLEGQSRSIAVACSLAVYECGEELNGMDQEREKQLASYFNSSFPDMRRFQVEFPDRISYRGYVVKLPEDNWYVKMVDMFIVDDGKQEIHSDGSAEIKMW